MCPKSVDYWSDANYQTFEFTLVDTTFRLLAPGDPDRIGIHVGVKGNSNTAFAETGLLWAQLGASYASLMFFGVATTPPPVLHIWDNTLIRYPIYYSGVTVVVGNSFVLTSVKRPVNWEG